MKNKYLKKIDANFYGTIKINTEQSNEGIVFMPYILKEHTTESLKEYNSFMKMYRKQHEVCPKCGAKEHFTTFMSYPMYSDRREEYKDLNRCVCICGDIHICHDRISIKEFKK